MLYFTEYQNALIAIEKTNHNIQDGNRFQLTARGRDKYILTICRTRLQARRPVGYAGIIIPTGIATDATTAPFFSSLVETKRLTSLYDFENKNQLFPIHRSFKFCLLTLNGSSIRTGSFDFAFFLHATNELKEKELHFTLTAEEIALINPNTMNSPIFRTRKDAEITKAVYKRIPVLIEDGRGDAGNYWGIILKQGLFNMTSDSHLFRTREQMEAAGYHLEGNRFIKDGEIWLPMYEAKMFWQFDHRHGTFEGVRSRDNTTLPSPSINQKKDGQDVILPGYWLNKKEIDNELINSHQFLVFRRISNSTNERTIIATFIPRTPVNDKGVMITSNEKLQLQSCLLANLNSISFDYIARKKVGGTQVDFFIMKDFPVIPPKNYTQEKITFIASRVIELTYTAWDLEPFAQNILKEIGADTWNYWYPHNQV